MKNQFDSTDAYGQCFVNNSVQTEVARPLQSANTEGVAENIGHGEECPRWTFQSRE